MPNKKFLEDYSLYKKFNHDIPSYNQLKDLRRPAIHMYCSVCESEQTFNMANNYYETDYSQFDGFENRAFRLKYLCSACERSIRFFHIFFGSHEVVEGNKKRSASYVMKIGQFPAWEIGLDKELEAMLGEHADYYKKAVVCESQSYGIGAHAYFRRVAEDILDQLLDSISELMPPADKAQYAEVLAKVKQAKVAEEKIRLVKDLLPSSLIPDGINPLGVLYDALSVGLHESTDEECLMIADEIKRSLVFLVNQVIKTKSSSKSFTAGMKRLLEAKAKRLAKGFGQTISEV